LAEENFVEFGGSISIHQNILSQILAKYTECIQYGTSIRQYIICQIHASSKISQILVFVDFINELHL